MMEKVRRKIFGVGDIQLPNESGKVDPRLPDPGKILRKDVPAGIKELKKRGLMK